MRYRRTQIYLDPEDHRALSQEAQRRGISLAALIRLVVSQRAGEMSGAEARTFAPLIGVVGESPPTDVAKRGREYMDEALERRLDRKLGR